ncbi:MAG TPA: hypothetical protein H9816_07470 [Candidatus Tidjanibacter faecipullorum]|uniref:Uncharacterized protein n=1 Tax=Candidatus Tidjanibacter faecipullorum TaxID=2838766 RepID=A0A9D2DF16_9BACT|nr:hypothetical protein [Candidatus Tidjanibacter faecipullorum]
MARFFYTPKPRQFSYKPRFYDPEKEAREKRREELLGVRPAEGEEYVPGELLRRRRMQRMMEDATAARRKKQKGSGLLLVAFIVLLIVAFLWLSA